MSNPTRSHTAATCKECRAFLQPFDPAPLCDACDICARVEASEYTPKREVPRGNLHELRELIAEHGGETRVGELLRMRGIL